MSPYIIIGAIAAALAFFGANRRFERVAFAMSFTVLLLFLALRYGQGTDWLAYNYIFQGAPSEIDFESVFYTEAYHSEIGWKLLNNIVKALGFDFLAISVVSSIIEMFLLARFVNRFSPNRALSLLIAFPVVYMTYFFSAMRQGLVIAVFLGVMVEWLQKGETVKYLFLTLLAISIHSLSVILFVPLIVSKLNYRSLGTILALSGVGGALLISAMPSLVSLFASSYTGNSISVVALAYRIVTAVLIYFMYTAAKKQDKTDDLELLIKVYLSGLAIYLLLMGNDLLASRLASPLLAVDIALIPILVKRGSGKLIAPLMLVFLLLIAIMSVKNIDSCIEQGDYYSGINILNYPYINVFNQEEIGSYTSSRYLLYLK